MNTPPSPGAVSLEEVDRDVENSVEGDEAPKRLPSSRNRPQSHALLGSFEESALNGRLEPVSTVHGFTAEIGASGSFCPKHRKLPVTVFFYTLGDNDKVSTPYLVSFIIIISKFFVIIYVIQFRYFSHAYIHLFFRRILILVKKVIKCREMEQYKLHY